MSNHLPMPDGLTVVVEDDLDVAMLIPVALRDVCADVLTITADFERLAVPSFWRTVDGAIDTLVCDLMLGATIDGLDILRCARSVLGDRCRYVLMTAVPKVEVSEVLPDWIVYLGKETLTGPELRRTICGHGTP